MFLTLLNMIKLLPLSVIVLNLFQVHIIKSVKNENNCAVL